MDLLEIIRKRRSIRKYQDKKVPREILDKIIDAGLYAPSAGGGQRSKIVAIQDKALCEYLGRINYSTFSRGNLAGSYVSSDQPSIIDDPSIRNAFYGAPSVCVIFSPRNFLYGIPDAFCMAENMVLEAYSLGVSSCIVARAEDTFSTAEGKKLLEEWNIPDALVARCFVTLGYCEGEYPSVKERKENRTLIIE